MNEFDDNLDENLDGVEFPEELPAAEAAPATWRAPMPWHAPMSLPEAAAATPAPAAPSSVRDYIGERLAKQAAAMKGAQTESRQNQGIADITEGLGQMSAGLAHAPTFNSGSYKYLHDEANQPVMDLQNLQKSKLTELQNATAERGANRAATLDDPNSMESTVSRNLAKAQLQKYGEDPSIVDGMSASDLKEFMQKPLDQMESRASREAITKLRVQANELKSRELAQGKQDKADLHSKESQDRVHQSTKMILESARGNGAFQQAERDIYAASKADSLAKLYGDPNKLNPQMVKLLVSEVAKMASGGTPTMTELKELNPNAFPSELSSVIQKFINRPSPANAGEFVKQYQDYAKALTKDAQKLIEDRYGRIIESSRRQLGEENYQDLRKYYIDRFKEAAGGDQKSAGDNWDDTKEARMQKLLKKQEEGTLDNGAE